MMPFAVLFTVAAAAHSIDGRDPRSGEVHVEIGVADLAMHRNSHSAMMRKQSDTIVQTTNLADIQRHSSVKSNDAQALERVTNDTSSFHVHVMESHPVVLCTFVEHVDNRISCDGLACGGHTSLGDDCTVDGHISGSPGSEESLVPTNPHLTEWGSMHFSSENQGCVELPDDHLLVSSSDGYPNRTVMFFFHVNGTTGNTEPRVIYAQGDANLGGITIYVKESLPGELFLHMFAYNHEKIAGSAEFGLEHVNPNPIECQINERGGTYFAAFVFQQHADGKAYYDGRLWKHGHNEVTHCGTADGKMNVTLPNRATIPKTGHGDGPITLGCNNRTVRTNWEHKVSPAHHCNCTLDSVAIYNRVVTDAEMFANIYPDPSNIDTEEYHPIQGLLCYADDHFGRLCQNRIKAFEDEARDNNVLAGTR